MFQKKMRVPAKAMLFGEYGVLAYFPAIAVTFYNYFFDIDVEITPNGSRITNVRVNSLFFKRGDIVFSFDKEPDDESEFFYKLFLPWKDRLLGLNITVDIRKSFPSNLGFGSSSAIIAAVCMALYEYLYGMENILYESQFWDFVRQSLFQIQGEGSAYDIGVQLAAIMKNDSSLQVWKFQNQVITTVPLIEQLKIPLDILKQYGCFVKTYIYANTQKILNNFINSKDKNEITVLNGESALHFLQKYTIENIKKLMNKSHNIMAVPEEMELIYSKLYGIPFKPMGAGLGDCLWVLSTKKQLMLNGFKEEDIAFAFEDLTDTL